MLFQKILTGPNPYFVNKIYIGPFMAHRHSELELHYCISGTYKIRINDQTYTLQEGDIALVGSMVSHEIPSDNTLNQALIIEAGAMLLKEQFAAFSDVEFIHPVYRADDSDEKAVCFRKKAGELCAEIANEYTLCRESSELQIIGNLYKIYAYIMDEILDNRNIIRRKQTDFRAVENIENALGLIYNCYSENISVEDAATLTGYNKSNFCKIFKNIVGDSFHQVLNRHRIEIASSLLYETSSSIEEIAVAVGFADSKSFCRVFKTFMGVSPGQYRKTRRE